MGVGTLRTGLVFVRLLIWGVTCLGLHEKWMFSPLSPWKHHKCVLKPQNRARFCEIIYLRGHMSRFTLKMNVFPSISLEMPEMCVLTIRRWFAFLSRSIWGVTCLGLFEKWTFSHLSPWKHHKCVLKPQNRARFSKMIDLRGHMPRFTWKWTFSHLSP